MPNVNTEFVLQKQKIQQKSAIGLRWKEEMADSHNISLKCIINQLANKGKMIRNIGIRACIYVIIF